MKRIEPLDLKKIYKSIENLAGGQEMILLDGVISKQNELVVALNDLIDNQEKGHR